MKIIQSIILCIVFCLAFVFFLPKQNLYYILEQELNKYNIVISNEKIIPQLVGLRLENGLIYVKGINIAKLDNVNIFLNSIDISSKEIGYANGKVDIFNQNIIVTFKPTNIFIEEYNMVLKYFKKENDGVYKYEYKLF